MIKFRASYTSEHGSRIKQRKKNEERETKSTSPKAAADERKVGKKARETRWRSGEEVSGHIWKSIFAKAGRLESAMRVLLRPLAPLGVSLNLLAVRWPAFFDFFLVSLLSLMTGAVEKKGGLEKPCFVVS